MVLEDSSSTQDNSFTDQAPSSDADTYAGGNAEYREGKESTYLLVTPKGANPVYVNLNNIPQPFDPFGLQGGPIRYRQFVRTAILRACEEASQVLQRPVKQEEADAFAFNVGKTIRLGSYGSPVGATLAMLQCYRSSSSFRFPGWSPMKEGSGRSPDRFGPLRGPLARVAWQSSRFSAYFIVGTLLGQIFFGSYAISVGLADRYRDPRLQELRSAIQKKMRERGIGGTGQRQPDGPGPHETPEMARQRRSVQRTSDGFESSQGALRRPARDDLDMSPTGGTLIEDYTRADDTGLMDDAQIRQRESQQARDSRTSSSDDSWTQSTNTNQSSSQAYGTSNSSSSSRNQSSTTGAQQQSSSSGGSAWDRLRQNAQSNQSGSGLQPTASWPKSDSSASKRASSKSDDSFSFSKREEDQQLARAEAQKEFDARIERERSGKDFDDGSDKGWRK